MRPAYALLGLVWLMIFVAGAWALTHDFAGSGSTLKKSSDMVDTSMASTTLTLHSPVFENGASIPSRFTCDGENMSPPLSWSGVPEGTKTLALIVDDPDVPKQLKPDGVFDHWTLFNIPATTTELTTGGTAGVHGANGAGKNQYTGPCPPPQYEPSEHRYVFRLYALDTDLSLGEGASKADVLAAMQGHIIAQAELLGRYKRQ